MRVRSVFPHWLRYALIAGLSCCQAQQPPTEIATHEAPLTFQSRVNLVTVPVVVRDSNRRVLQNLNKDDFQLFDSGKPQIVSRFTVEKTAVALPSAPTPAGAPPVVPPPAVPQRYVALVFDDLHTDTLHLTQARQAAEKVLASAIGPSERIAIYPTSGRNAVDFTNDRDRLEQALLAIRSGVKPEASCPRINYWEADQIVNHSPPPGAGGDSEILDAMEDEVAACSPLPYSADELERIVVTAAKRVVTEGDADIRQSLDDLGAVIRKLTTMPGQRSLVLISDGFLVLDDRRPEEMDLIEQAIRANVVVDALGARGLETLVPGGDASQRGALSNSKMLFDVKYANIQAAAATAVMAETAESTGGRFFENSNALDQGLELLAGQPECIYLLGFAPQNLTPDGRYHTLKVTLRNPKGLTVDARPGYYAPNRARDPAERAKEEIQTAFFSAEDIHEIPATIETQFFKTGPDEATVNVLAKVDVRKLNFKQEDGRNRNDVTVVCGLFDENGNYVSGIQKVLEMRLKDATLATGLPSGISVKSSLKAKPGKYLVRVVVRDSQGQDLTALSSAVEIP
jgi:VWFA-related protein